MSGRLLPRRFPLVLVRFGRRYPLTVITAAILSWVVAGFFASRVQIETDVLSLVPQTNTTVENFKTTIERFGTVDSLLVVVRLGSLEDREADLAFADVFADSLREWELIDWVEYKVEGTVEVMTPLLDHAFQFMEAEDVEKIISSLDGPGLESHAARIYSDFVAPQGLVAKNILQLDPFGVLPALVARLRLSGTGLAVDPQTGVLIDPEGQMLLMLARPVSPALDLAFNRVLVSGLEERVGTARQTWREEGWQSTAPEVEFTGGYVVTLDDSELIISDAVIGIVSALIGVMALFLVAFRRRAALVYAFVPIVTGLGLTFVFGALVLGRLNSLTSAFGGLLIGLGIDFIIVLYGRYVEERNSGRSHVEAVDAMGEHTGVGVMLGAVTTAGTFYAFLITDFKGLWELGLLTGTGILLLAVSVFTLLPALLTKLQDRRSDAARHVIRSFGSDRLCAASLRRTRLTLWIVAGLSVVFLLAMRGLVFDDDIQNMRSPDNRGIVLRNEVMQSFGMRFTPMTVRVDAATEIEALDAARKLLPELEALIDGENLAEVDSIVQLLPDAESQQQVFEVLEASPVEDLAQNFGRALRAEGLNPAAFSRGVEHFQEALGARTPLSVSDLDGTIFEAVVSRYIVDHGDGVSIAIRCYPPAGMWRREAPPKLQEVIDRHPDAVLTGPNVVSAELRSLVWGDAIRASLLGMVIVFLLLWADFGSPVRSLLALFPLVLGMVWMLGVMSMLGLQVNFMNIFVVTMVIGIGVDYSVHLLHRWAESGGDPEALSQTAKAIAVASLTTIVGFGSLVLSHYPGLRSVGAAAILGALATAVLSITALPVVLRSLDWLRRRS